MRKTHASYGPEGVQYGVVLTGLLLIGFGATHAMSAEQELSVQVVSSHPDAISGGDVLVLLVGSTRARWSAHLNGREVTAAFRPTEEPGRLLALLDGLKVGKNTLEVKAHGSVVRRLEIIDHPLAGPTFSGPHQKPFICETEANGLGVPLDTDCGAPTSSQYYYKSTEPVVADPWTPAPAAGPLSRGFKVFDPSAALPADVAQTVTSDGQSVPYIVRRELGTINRGVYEIEFLHQPGTPLPTPWTRPTPGWNGRLVYVVGGGCSAGYRQGTLGATNAANEPFIAQGYATARSTLSSAGTDCNDRISAESLSMVKEHFIKHYGVPIHTIGWGTSGGAIHEQMIAQNYPGLLDGLMLDGSFPDVATTDGPSSSDCALLDRAFAEIGQGWSEHQKAAVSGFATWRTCTGRWNRWPLLDPRKNCPSSVDATAARCDLYDNEITIYGRNPRTGFAYRPLDNVGVQYGLAPFNRGQIDARQFIDLNAHMGGFDDEGNIVPVRMTADLEGLHNAYRRGLVLTGGGGLAEVPIIDERDYDDDLADQHDSVRSFETRARLMAANGSASNQVILRYPRWALDEALRVLQGVEVFMDIERDLVQEMNHWLDNMSADTAAGTQAQRAARNKPTELADACWASDGERIVEAAVYGLATRCNQLYPPYATSRMAAGGSLSDDVLKCALKPVDARDYTRPLTPEELHQLKAVFPDGVCDYTRPGIGQEVTRAVWQRF